MSFRVVSLVPSATETLIDWGVVPIAVTRFCERPELPHVGGTKDPLVGDIVELRPDLVVMCDQENRREDFEALEEAGLNVFAFSITHLDHVEPQLRQLAEQLDTSPRSTPIPTLPLHVPQPDGSRCSVFVPIWKRPWMTINADTYASSLLVACGFDNVFADAVVRYPEVSAEEIGDRSPERVLAPSEPYPFAERHRTLLEQFGPVTFVDGKDVFWWGSRTESAVRRLDDLRSALATA